MYRVIQEAFNNIVKHSEANAAKLELKLDAENLMCKVLDNGKGLDLETSFDSSKSLGLKTMQERIVSLGGNFKISRNIPNGTTVEFSMPL